MQILFLIKLEAQYAMKKMIYQHYYKKMIKLKIKALKKRMIYLSIRIKKKNKSNINNDNDEGYEVGVEEI